jgi:tetratricopeptide (TPR) repeat protein
VQIFRASGATRELIPALLNLAILRRQASRLDDSIAAAEEAERIARATGHRRLLSRSISEIGITLQESGRHREALARQEEALAIAEEIGDLSMQAVALNACGTMQVELGGTELARTLLERGVALARRAGNAMDEALLLGNLGVAELLLGRPGAARSAFEEALAIALRIDDAAQVASMLSSLSSVCVEVKRLDEALDYARRAVAAGSAAGEGRALAVLEMQLASVLGRMGDPAALGMLRQVRSRLASAGDPYTVMACLCEEARVLVASGLAADEELAHAERIAAALGLEETSELVKTVHELRDAARAR